MLLEGSRHARPVMMSMFGGTEPCEFAITVVRPEPREQRTRASRRLEDDGHVGGDDRIRMVQSFGELLAIVGRLRVLAGNDDCVVNRAVRPLTHASRWWPVDERLRGTYTRIGAASDCARPCREHLEPLRGGTMPSKHHE